MAITDQRAEELRREALQYHRERRGKIEVNPKVTLRNMDELSLAYTPGVAEPVKEIAADAAAGFEYTARGNTVAVVSDGSAVLGLGDVGPEAAMPVMEGKSVLFKLFAGVDAVPICLAQRGVGRLVETISALTPTFGGINLEDISAPRCFEIEARLKERLDIPVFHDDQHGTAIVVAAALINSVRLVGKQLDDISVVVNGAGAAGMATAYLLADMGVGNITLCDSKGAIYSGRPVGMNPYKESLAKATNPEGRRGSLEEVMKGTDVFIGLSVAGAVSADMVKQMAPDAVVMAMANPVPEIYPDEAAAAGARVVCTGRSDYPNQINNVLAFPGVFRGALDVRARDINDEMKIAAAKAIADLVSPDELREDYIIPDVWNQKVAPAVAAAVGEAAVASGVARTDKTASEIYSETTARVDRVRKALGLSEDGGEDS